MAVTVMEMIFKKHSPIGRQCRDYKYFDEIMFKNDLRKKFGPDISCYESFENIFVEVLNINTPLRKKFLRVNNVPYMTKTYYGKLS